MILRYRTFLVLLVAGLVTGVLFPSLAAAGLLFEQKTSYRTAPGDTLSSIGARFGVDWRSIAEENRIDPDAPLRAGQRLRITLRKIIPRAVQRGIIIDIPGRMLYLFDRGTLDRAIPVGLGAPKGNGQRGWETPAGRFTIVGKRTSPTWLVPKSIQEEMRREGAVVKESLPPGPKSPLGRYAVRTSLPGIVIHETTDPSTVYAFMSHGCVRVLPEHMGRLYRSVRAGMPGELIYRPVKVAVLRDGRVFMEVHRDIYGKIKDMRAEAQRVLQEQGVLKSVDWARVEQALKQQAGVPVEISAAPR